MGALSSCNSFRLLVKSKIGYHGSRMEYSCGTSSCHKLIMLADLGKTESRNDHETHQETV